jgi:nitrite reductase/ring-hydroxylating ferredoxin subunit
MAPLEIFGYPVCLVRGQDEEVRVFHNVGAHDACPVVLERQLGATEVVGPYHGWRYDLTGRFIAAPYWDGTHDPDVASLRERGGDLKEIRSQQWQDIVFMDLSGACVSLEEFLSPVTALLNDYDMESFQLANNTSDGDGIQRLTPRANWKSLWENYAANVLHASFVHEQYRDVVPVDDKGHRFDDEINDGVVKGVGFPTAELTKMARKSDGQPVNYSYILNTYPNLCLLAFPYRVRVGILVPKPAESSEWLIGTYFASDCAVDPAYRELREETQAATSRMLSVESAASAQRLCDSIAPFDGPVVPDVNKMVARSCPNTSGSSLTSPAWGRSSSTTALRP